MTKMKLIPVTSCKLSKPPPLEQALWVISVSYSINPNNTQSNKNLTILTPLLFQSIPTQKFPPLGITVNITPSKLSPPGVTNTKQLIQKKNIESN